LCHLDHGAQATAFVTNGLTGTVSRLDFTVKPTGLTLVRSKTIASGYVHRADSVTFVVSPTGLVYDESGDTLYVASTGDNEVFAIGDARDRMSDAGTGRLVYQDNTHLHGPLAMTEAPNDHLLVSNNDGINPDPNQPSEIVEFTKNGTFVKQLSVDSAQGGAFGLAVQTLGEISTFAAVDDNTATLTIWQLSH
jgi:sugar lactone lactonase YvrE